MIWHIDRKTDGTFGIVSYELQVTEKYLCLIVLRNGHRRKSVQPAARCFHIQVNTREAGGATFLGRVIIFH